MAIEADDLLVPRVTRLVVYPVKGCAGQPGEAVEVGPRGLAWDRRWMLVDEAGGFLSQRQAPIMATIRAIVVGDELRLSHAGGSAAGGVVVPVAPPPAAPRVRVRIWRSEVEAVCLPEAGRWLSDILGRRCELVFMPEETRRPVDPRFAGAEDIVGFADGYPVLLVGEASLADLNARLGEGAAVPMERFRPNVVVSTAEPFVEDGWGELEIGGARLAGAKACERCAVPTVDQQSGERCGPEPIRRLATYRRLGAGGGGGVFFGQNLLVRRAGRIAVGEPVTVWSRQPAIYGP